MCVVWSVGCVRVCVKCRVCACGVECRVCACMCGVWGVCVYVWSVGCVRVCVECGVCASLCEV